MSQTLSSWVIDRVVGVIRPWRFRGKLRLLGALAPRKGRRRVRLFGTPLELDLADEIQRQAYLGCFEPEETAWVRRLLRPGMTFLDVGANVGYFTLLASSLVGATGRVVAVEPSPSAFAALARATADLGNVSAVPVGLSDSSGTLALYVPPEAHGNHAPTMIATPGWQEVRVEVLTLDELTARHGLERIDLLKLDVEGHEARILGGAVRALSERRIGAVLCEFNDYWLRQAGSSPAEVWRMLSDHGFRDAERPGEEPAWTDGGLQTRLLVLAD